MFKSIYLQAVILGTVAVFVVDYASHVQTKTAPITSPSPTSSSTSHSLPPKPELIPSPTASAVSKFASPYLGDYQISHLPSSA